MDFKVNRRFSGQFSHNLGGWFVLSVVGQVKHDFQVPKLTHIPSIVDSLIFCVCVSV